jgi:general stress protein YciG
MPNTKKDQERGSDTSKRGFASMDEEKQKEIAGKGGKAAHESGNAHELIRRKQEKLAVKAAKLGAVIANRTILVVKVNA